MTNTETTNPAPKTYRRGNIVAVPTRRAGEYQVMNVRTGTALTQPRPTIRALRIFAKVTR